MADNNETEKTLEMRVAELEDKLKNLHVTEEEMKAYNKVASMMGGATSAAAPSPAAGGAVGLTPTPDACVINQCIRACTVVQPCIQQCIVHQCTIVQPCTIRPCTIRACTIRQCCIQECINECIGGGGFGGGGLGGGGFGGLGG
ncbi:hypothetical protein [Bradyrhizobium sp.]|jgi:hypothetical protein|uniref:hypothetical protein n=1 Tax=Bradyrhizobium sp. TaxID=376 RepID=UPI002E02F036|nr:hypothetical protein [Bradyrhizobium sp.]